MTVYSSIRSSVLSSIRDSVKGGESPPSSVTRTFVNLDPVAQAHYLLSTEEAFAGDLSIKFNVMCDNQAYVLIGNDSNTSSFIAHIKNRKLRVAIQGVSYDSDNDVFEIGKLNTVEVNRASGSWECFVNGTLVLSFTNSNDWTLNAIGRYEGSSFMLKGIISDVRFDNEGTINTFLLNEETANIEDSVEGGNSVSYINIPADEREQFQLNEDETRWDNISDEPQELPSIIDIAPQA